MPAARDKRKLYKAVKKEVNGAECFVIKFKNLSKQDIKDVRAELNAMCKDFWTPIQETEYSEEEKQDVVRM